MPILCLYTQRQFTMITNAPVMCKDFSIVENKTSETHHETFLKTMAELLLDKDVLVLISSAADERIELAQAIFLKACRYTCTQGTNIRMANCFHDLRGLEKEKRASVLFIHDTFKPEEKIEKSAVHDAFKIIQDAKKISNNEIHALYSIPSEECDDFVETVNNSSLKFAVYDLSTMQERKTKRKWFSFFK